MNSLSHRLQQISQALRARYDDPQLCDQYAWWMLLAITKKEQEQLITQDAQLTREQEETLQTWIQKQITEHMPLQYLIGSVPFNDVTILVEPPILIPRPETEEWTADLIERIEQTKLQKFRVLDMCSGSGCIALAFAKTFVHAQIVGADISERAVALARKNAALNGVTNATFIVSDLFDQVPLETFDLIVCNPPYIDPIEWSALDRSVTAWEDKQALIAPDGGLAVIKKIIDRAPEYLIQNNQLKSAGINQLWIEMDINQSEALSKYMIQRHYSDIHVQKDLSGKPRVISGRIDVAQEKK